jgi:polysaccharide pyruvyl transferase WcaK-like protein
MKQILIINQYSANKGDRAVLFSLLRLLKPFKDLLVTISTSDPSDWESQFTNEGINLVPWGWDYHVNTRNLFKKLKFFLLRRIQPMTYSVLRTILIRSLPSGLIKPIVNPAFYRAVMNSDLVISTGGHHITTLLTKNAVSSQLFDLGCCIVLKKKMILWSQTIGPLDFSNRKNERFIKILLQRIESIYVRDKGSADLAISMGVKVDNVNTTFETVLSLNDLAVSYKPVIDRKNVVGISIYSTVSRSDTELDNYINALSHFADFCVEKKDCEVLFIPMELKNSGPDDRWLIKKIIDKIQHKDRCSLMDRDLSTEDHFNLIQECRYFVGHKTHSVIFALAAGTPLVALAYHSKTIEFMSQYGLSDYVISDNELNSGLLVSTFEEMTKDAENIGEYIFIRSKAIAKKIKSDFDSMIQFNLHG